MKPGLITFACSVCFQDPNSIETKGLHLAVLFLLVTVGGVLSVIASVGITWARRAARLKN